MLDLDLGGRGVTLRHLGRGHTDHDLVVHVPDAGAVFVQKVLPYGEVSARLIGVGLLVAAAAVALT